MTVSKGSESFPPALQCNRPDGVIDRELPVSKRKLPRDWALQHPADYIEVLEETIPSLLKQSKADPKEIIGIGIDFTVIGRMLERPVSRKLSL